MTSNKLPKTVPSTVAEKALLLATKAFCPNPENFINLDSDTPLAGMSNRDLRTAMVYSVTVEETKREIYKLEAGILALCEEFVNVPVQV